MVLFDGFELLDVFGPVEIFSMLPELISVDYLGASAGPVRSSQGAEVVVPTAYMEAATPDIVLVPGGLGTRALVGDAAFLRWLAGWATEASLVASVCTGSAVLAAAGLLDGYRATSNKRAFAWASSHGRDVEWVTRARWVEDRDRWTSSGVAAGMDMAAALVGALFGPEVAREAVERIELETHPDASWDPFAAVHGLL